MSPAGESRADERLEALLSLARAEQSGLLREFLERARPQFRDALGAQPAEAVAPAQIGIETARPGGGADGAHRRAALPKPGPRIAPGAAGSSDPVSPGPRASSAAPAGPTAAAAPAVSRGEVAAGSTNSIENFDSKGPKLGSRPSVVRPLSREAAVDPMPRVTWPDLSVMNLEEFRGRLEALQGDCKDPAEGPLPALTALADFVLQNAHGGATREQVVEQSRRFIEPFYRGWGANRAWLTQLDSDLFLKAIRRFLDERLSTGTSWRLRCPNVPCTYRHEDHELAGVGRQSRKGQLRPGSKVRPVAFGVSGAEGEGAPILPLVAPFSPDDFLSGGGS